MKGIILAAGHGTRLGLLTRCTPKPLLAVAGRPMVTYGLQALVEAGVTELIVVLGHLGEQIRHALGETTYRGVHLTYVESADRRDGNGLSLYAAREAVGDEPFILVMADHLFSACLVRQLLATPRKQSTLCVDRQPSPIIQVGEATQVRVDQMGWVTRIGKNLPRWNGLDTGVFWLTPASFRAVETLQAEGLPSPTLAQVCRSLIEHGKGLKACDVSGRFWTDLDTPTDLRRAERVLKERNRSPAQSASREVA